ncbi:MAG: hypothetical protein HY744_12390 [Deltaproteobacteria bacterium]|nr:hypothetical protein [Deltaproteobacteria bacterium]
MDGFVLVVCAVVYLGMARNATRCCVVASHGTLEPIDAAGRPVHRSSVMTCRTALPATACLLALGLGAADAAATSGLDYIEHVFGTSNTNAVGGHGALTIGVSADGDLTVLGWPTASFADQLAYVASNDWEARSAPHLGAQDGMGSYLGLLVTTDGAPALTWLRAQPWTHAQSYTTPDAPVPITTFSHAELGLSVTVTDVVSPDIDVLSRLVRVERGAGSPVTAVSLVLYENLSPTLSRIPELPFADWALDSRNDFLAAWDAKAGAILHFHPRDGAVIDSLADVSADLAEVDYGPVEALMKSEAPAAPDVDAFVAGIDGAYGPGVAALVTTEPAPSALQVGSDTTPICAQIDKLADNIIALPEKLPDVKLGIDPGVANMLRCKDIMPALAAKKGWKHAPEDALADLGDGELSGSPLAAGQTNGALVAPLAWNGGVAEGAALFAFGESVAAARDVLVKAEATKPHERLAAAEAAAAELIGQAALPAAELGERVELVARRALANVYVARDRASGALLASVARQPPYHLDWPRDGAFFSAGLDLAGLAPLVTQRAVWYVGLQRSEPTAGNPLLTPEVTVDPDTGAQEFPAYAWEMNYFSDGVLGGPIRFEIDNTALHVWAVASHAASLEGEARAAFVAKVWPSTRDALDLLARWRDAATGLPAPANEDDSFALTSTLHGAVAVYVGLEQGARLANHVGELEPAQRYLRRAQELQAAILKSYYDPGSGLFRGEREGPGGVPGETQYGGGSTAWRVWPGCVLGDDDPRLEAQLLADMNAVLPRLQGKADGGVYAAKNVLAAALCGKKDGSRELARQAVVLLADVATPDTLHFGEVYVTVPGEKGPTFSNRVAPPHVWEGMLFYLSAMALTAPERFDPARQAFPLPELPPVATEAVGGGCGCRTSPAPVPTLAALAWLLAAALAVRRYPRPLARPATPGADSAGSPRDPEEPPCHRREASPSHARPCWPRPPRSQPRAAAAARPRPPAARSRPPAAGRRAREAARPEPGARPPARPGGRRAGAAAARQVQAEVRAAAPRAAASRGRSASAPSA